MKKSILIAICAGWALTSSAQEFKSLPQPTTTGGMPLMQALAERTTVRQYTGEPLTDQQLSDLLWAAWGVNREDGKRTAPSANNLQEIDLYLFTSEGGYRYDAVNNRLEELVKGDYRGEVCTGAFGSTAAVNLFFVADFDKRPGNDTAHKREISSIDAGYISQNIYLFCASEGLGTVVYTGSLNRKRVAELLSLPESRWVVGGQSVGKK